MKKTTLFDGGSLAGQTLDLANDVVPELGFDTDKEFLTHSGKTCLRTLPGSNVKCPFSDVRLVN